MPEKKDSTRNASPEPKAPKARKHGYRGYGSGIGKDPAAYGGRIHWGTGFAGVEPLSGKRDGLLDSGLLTDLQKEEIPKSGETASRERGKRRNP